jgi:D-glycero-D-manno-heptose 1,7-bisphosphate phosphatase
MKKLVVFDRDGTLIVDNGYTHDTKDLKWVKGATQLLRELNEKGVIVVVATNQSGIGRGYFTFEEVKEFHAQMSREILINGGKIESFYVCPHAPGSEGLPECKCRKPNPGMLVSAMQDFNVTPEQCLFIGNSQSDLEAAKNAGIDFILVGSHLHVKKVLEACKC